MPRTLSCDRAYESKALAGGAWKLTSRRPQYRQDHPGTYLFDGRPSRSDSRFGERACSVRHLRKQSFDRRSPQQVFAGDKSGNLALWDCTHAGERIPDAGATKLKNAVGDDGEDGGDDEEEQAETNYGKWWNWRAHRTNSVSWLKFRPGHMESVRSFRFRTRPMETDT